jgi:hypothetical protein
MNILAYGEDALTLWAFRYRLAEILDKAGDRSLASECKIFFRPSFGRRGGAKSSQFGEFDFIILAQDNLYLGESKWDRSSELAGSNFLTIREEQVLRHRLFRFYVREWAFGQYISWNQFIREATAKLDQKKIQKPLAPTGSLLASNLMTVLDIIRRHFSTEPQVTDLLLFLHDGSKSLSPAVTPDNFCLIPIDFSRSLEGNFISIEM